MKDVNEYMLTGTCTIYRKTGKDELMEFFGMDRHVKKDDFKAMIKTCLEFIRWFKAKQCDYKVVNNLIDKEVLNISVIRNEFFDDMFDVTVNGKQFGWFFLSKYNKYPHLAFC